MEAFKNRLQTAMDARGLRQVDLCNALGLSRATVSNYISGNRRPGPEKMVQLAKILKVSPAWLNGYEAGAVTGLTENEKELLAIFRQMDERDQLKLIGKAEAMAEEKKS